MTTRRTLAALGITAATLGTVLATAAPASAGGTAVIAGPAFDNTCITLHRTPRAATQLAKQPGIRSHLLPVPMHAPRRHCGGADVDYIADATGIR